MLPNFAPMWLFVGTFAFSTAARDVVYPLIIAESFGIRYLAKIYGGLMVALLPGGVLGPLFAAAIHERFGSYDLAFATFAALNALAFAALLLVRRELPRARQTVALSD
jgi:cyanate permease